MSLPESSRVSYPPGTSNTHDLSSSSSDDSLSTLIRSIKLSTRQSSSEPREKNRSDPPSSETCGVPTLDDGQDDASAFGPTRDPMQKHSSPRGQSRGAQQRKRDKQCHGTHRPGDPKPYTNTSSSKPAERCTTPPMDPPCATTRKAVEPPIEKTKEVRRSNRGKRNSKSKVVDQAVVCSSSTSGNMDSFNSDNAPKSRSEFLVRSFQNASETSGMSNQRPNKNTGILGSKRFNIRPRDRSGRTGANSGRGNVQQPRSIRDIDSRSILRVESLGDDEPSHKEALLLTSKPTEKTNTTTGVLVSQKHADGIQNRRKIHNSDSTISTLSGNYEFSPQQGQKEPSRQENHFLHNKLSEATADSPRFRQIKQMESNRSTVLNWSATNQSSVLIKNTSSLRRLLPVDDDDGASLGSFHSDDSASSRSTAIEEIIARCQRKLVYNRAPVRNYTS